MSGWRRRRRLRPNNWRRNASGCAAPGCGARPSPVLARRPRFCRYQGSLDRTIRAAMANLRGLKSMRPGGVSRDTKGQKQTHFEAPPRSGPEVAEGPRAATLSGPKSAETKPLRGIAEKGPEAWRRTSEVISPECKNAKTNPLTSMFTGNRHQRRKAKVLARRHRSDS